MRSLFSLFYIHFFNGAHTVQNGKRRNERNCLHLHGMKRSGKIKSKVNRTLDLAANIDADKPYQASTL